MTALLSEWSVCLTTNQDVAGSIPSTSTIVEVDSLCLCERKRYHYFLDFKRKIWTWTPIRTSDLQITSLALLPIELSKFPFQFMFKRSSWNDKCQTLQLFTCKPLKEERLNMNWNGNLDSSIGKSARLVIWRSEVRIPVQVQIILLKSKL